MGKSSLLNAIFGEERAIVSDTPGTTRDIVTGRYTYRSLPLRFLDTAGIRQTGDSIERMGVERSQAAIQKASVAVVLVDGSAPLTEEDKNAIELAKNSPAAVIPVLNKSDLPGSGVAEEVERLAGSMPISISAKQGQGISAARGDIRAGGG